MRVAVVLSLILCACSTDTFATNDAGDASSDVTGPDAPLVDGGPQPCTCTGQSVCKSGVCIAPMTAEACLVASGEYVYWTNGQTVASGGAVYRMKIADGTVEVVAVGQEAPRAIAADDTRLFWSTNAAIRSSAFGANVQPTTVTATAQPSTAMGVSNGMVFYGQQDQTVFVVPSQGGTPKPIDVADGVVSFMHPSGGRMFWTTAGIGDAGTANIESAPVDGGFARNEFSQPGRLTGFEVSTTVVTTFLVAYPTQNEIFSLVNTALPIVKASEPDDFELDSNSFMYWSERRDGGAIVKYDNDASTVVSKADYPHCITIVEPSIYWTAPGLVVPGVSAL